MKGGFVNNALPGNWHRLILSVLTAVLFLRGGPTFGADTPPHLSPYESQLLHSVNRYRIEHGLNPLRTDRTLQGLAGNHSRSMEQKNRLSHDAFPQRFTESGRSHCVENIGWNSRTAEDQMRGWKSSGGHDANLLNRQIRHAGIARYGDYVTFFACD